MKSKSLLEPKVADPLDVGARIEELKRLEPGWLDGKGAIPAKDSLVWLSETFTRCFPDELRSPYLFLTPEAHVLAEWSLKPWSPSIEIDLETRMGEWHELNLDTDEEKTQSLNLTLETDWAWIAERIRFMGGEAS